MIRLTSKNNKADSLVSRLKNGQLNAIHAVAWWTVPPAVLAAEYVWTAFALALLFPVVAFSAWALRTLSECLFNYDAHTPPNYGDRRLLQMTRTETILLFTGMIVSLYFITAFTSQSLSTVTAA